MTRLESLPLAGSEVLPRRPEREHLDALWNFLEAGGTRPQRKLVLDHLALYTSLTLPYWPE